MLKPKIKVGNYYELKLKEDDKITFGTPRCRILF